MPAPYRSLEDQYRFLLLIAAVFAIAAALLFMFQAGHWLRQGEWEPISVADIFYSDGPAHGGWLLGLPASLATALVSAAAFGGAVYVAVQDKARFKRAQDVRPQDKAGGTGRPGAV